MLQRARNTQAVELHITGRDVEEATWGLTFDPERGSWLLAGDPPWLTNMTGLRHELYEWIRSHGRAAPKEVADALPHVKLNTVQRTMARMAQAGQLHSDGSGTYWTPDLSALSADVREATDGHLRTETDGLESPDTSEAASPSAAPGADVRVSGLSALSVVKDDSGAVEELAPSAMVPADTTDRADKKIPKIVIRVGRRQMEEAGNG